VRKAAHRVLIHLVPPLDLRKIPLNFGNCLLLILLAHGFVQVLLGVAFVDFGKASVRLSIVFSGLLVQVKAVFRVVVILTARLVVLGIKLDSLLAG